MEGIDYSVVTDNSLGQVRIGADGQGRRATYDELEVGKDLGVADFRVTQEQIDQVCERTRYHHPFYEVDSPFGGTVAPIVMTFLLPRNMFSRVYNVRGLFYKWAYDFTSPVLPGVDYLVRAHVTDKWIKKEREFVAYEATCEDKRGNLIFTTRRAHVLDYIKTTAPKTASTKVSSGELTPEGRAARQPYWDPDWQVATAAGTGKVSVSPLATADTQLGSPLPRLSAFYSLEEIQRRAKLVFAGNPASLHIDYAAARQEGLPAPVANAQDVIELIEHSGVEFFGAGWIQGGKADLTLVRPVLPGNFLTSKGFVEAKEPLADGSFRLTCRVVVEDQKEQVKVAGTISGVVAKNV